MRGGQASGLLVVCAVFVSHTASAGCDHRPNAPERAEALQRAAAVRSSHPDTLEGPPSSSGARHGRGHRAGAAGAGWTGHADLGGSPRGHGRVARAAPGLRVPAEIWLQDSAEDREDRGGDPASGSALPRRQARAQVASCGEGRSAGIGLAASPPHGGRSGGADGCEKGDAIFEGGTSNPDAEAGTSPCTPVDAVTGPGTGAFTRHKSDTLTSMLDGVRRGVGVYGLGCSKNGTAETARSLSSARRGLEVGHGGWQRARGGDGNSSCVVDFDTSVQERSTSIRGGDTSAAHTHTRTQRQVHTHAHNRSTSISGGNTSAELDRDLAHGTSMLPGDSRVDQMGAGTAQQGVGAIFSEEHPACLECPPPDGIRANTASAPQEKGGGATRRDGQRESMVILASGECSAGKTPPRGAVEGPQHHGGGGEGGGELFHHGSDETVATPDATRELQPLPSPCTHVVPAGSPGPQDEVGAWEMEPAGDGQGGSVCERE
jgi:hypothetical protein